MKQIKKLLEFLSQYQFEYLDLSERRKKTFLILIIIIVVSTIIFKNLN